MNCLSFFLLFFLFSCSTIAQEDQWLSLDQMDTLIPDFDETNKLVGFKYPYRRCSKSFLKICTRWEYVEQKLPGDDVRLMLQIKARDYVLKIRQKP